jgi:hypothetical protein
MERGNEKKTGRKRTTYRFLQRQFRYLISAIPNKYKATIQKLINERPSILAFAKVAKGHAVSTYKAEVIHQRMQDNMSEILD